MPNHPERILILGGYGNFGARISERLARDPTIEVVIAGRDLARSRALTDKLRLKYPATTLATEQLDHTAPNLSKRLADIGPSVVIHTGGPFQNQDYHVARSCIRCGIHYVDLADGRKFVEGIRALDDDARRADLLLVSGASTLPGLSSAVVNHISPALKKIAGIDIGIVPGNHAPRGLSTIGAVLSYCGKPFTWLESGHRVIVHGWQNLARRDYPSLGSRLLGACDVPDLVLFPDYYPATGTVTFRAGLELRWQQWILWFMASLTRMGLVSDWSKHASICKKLGDATQSWGTGIGGMHVEVRGASEDGRPVSLTWYLTARQNHGPEVPCVPAIVLAKKLAKGLLTLRGAHPCLGLMSLEEFSAEIADLDITWAVTENPG